MFYISRILKIDMSFYLPTFTYMFFSFKNNLYAERCGSMLTQEDLAKEINVSRQTINAIEQGRRVPSVYIAMRLAYALHSSVERIFPLPKEFKNRNSTHI